MIDKNKAISKLDEINALVGGLAGSADDLVATGSAIAELKTILQQ